jgi:molybdopterin/thiamine biosynthesis adenylyltransferase
MVSMNSFSEDELEYYSRQIVMNEIGLNGQSRLKAARVLVAGLGGLGSPISTQLATMGVGFLRVVDRDVVEASNLQRQHLYSMGDLGLPKAEAASLRLS